MKTIRKYLFATLVIAGSTVAHAQTYNANIPLAYEDPGQPGTRAPDDSFGVETIDPYTGLLRIVTTDLVVPSNGGLDLKVVRNYQSLSSLVWPHKQNTFGRTLTGAGWDLHYGRLWVGSLSVISPQLTKASSVTGCRASNSTNKLNPVLEFPDGTRKVFSASDATVSGYAYITPDRWILKCLMTKDGAVVISPEGIQYTFDFWARVASGSAVYPTQLTYDNYAAAYHVTKVAHPNGTSIDVAYKSKTTNNTNQWAMLSSVTHSEGQSISFSYSTSDACGSPTNASQPGPHLNSFSNGGRTWSFEYSCIVDYSKYTSVGSLQVPDHFEYLDEIRRPDGERTRYFYTGKIFPSTAAPVAGTYSLYRVLTPEGGDVRYTYAYKTFPGRDQPTVQTPVQNVDVVVKKEIFGRPSGSVTGGTISSQPSPDTWTYFYQPSGGGSSNSDFDYTHVAGPSSCTVYQHYVGYAAALTWQVGSLMSKVIKGPNSGTTPAACSSSSTYRTEAYEWRGLQVAAQVLFRHPDFVLVASSTQEPKLAKQTITQGGKNFTTTYDYGTGTSVDPYGNPKTIVETGVTTDVNGSAATATRTTNYTYFTDTSAWILHRVKNQTVQSAGIAGGVSSDYGITRSYYSTSGKVGLLQTESRVGVSTSYDYNTGAVLGGTLLSETDANNYTTSYSGYKRGMPLITKRDIDGAGTNFKQINQAIYDTGMLQSRDDGEPKSTGYGYDSLNRLISVTTARTDDSNVGINITVENPGSLSSGTTASQPDLYEITRGQYKETRLFDGYGNLVRTYWYDTAVSGSPVVSQHYRYDEAGRVTKQYLPNSATSFVATDYDPLGRIIKKTNPDGTFVSYSHLNGNIVQVTDERGFKTTNYYRSFGDPDKQELVRIVADSGDTAGAATQTTVIDRNLIGQINSISQGGMTHTYRYNAKFQLYQEVHPEVGTVTYGLDNMGHITSRQVGASGITNFDLDRLYRVTRVRYPDGSAQTVDYYKNDLPRNVGYAGTNWYYEYDLNNNRTLERLTIPASGATFPLARQYDFVSGYSALDSKSTISYPSGLQVDYAPNAFGRPTKIGAKINGAITINFANTVSFYPNGQLQSIVLPNGVTTNYAQDGLLRVSGITSSATLDGVLKSLVNRQYLYDSTSNVRAINDLVSPSANKTMTYDGLSRLRTANGPWGSGAVTYTASNNIATKTFGTNSLAYAYDGTNRLAGVTGTTILSFAYDVYGNAISSGRTTYGNYQYDDSSLLRWVKNADNSQKIEYQHDANRRTVLERYVDGYSTAYKAYTQDGNLMSEEDLANNLAKDYVYLGTRLVASRTRCTATTDTDGDGASDCLEFQNGMSKSNPADASQDADNDGVSNAVEIQLGSNPYVADSDGDGLSDGYEYKNGLSPVLADANTDADGDGWSNMVEAQHGTNPLKADTDGDGIIDSADPNPTFNPAWLIPIFNMMLE